MSVRQLWCRMVFYVPITLIIFSLILLDNWAVLSRTETTSAHVVLSVVGMLTVNAVTRCLALSLTLLRFPIGSGCCCDSWLWPRCGRVSSVWFGAGVTLIRVGTRFTAEWKSSFFPGVEPFSFLFRPPISPLIWLFWLSGDELLGMDGARYLKLDDFKDQDDDFLSPKKTLRDFEGGMGTTWVTAVLASAWREHERITLEKDEVKLRCHPLSRRPYSPAIPRIPCVSPETVLLDQVELEGNDLNVVKSLAKHRWLPAWIHCSHGHVSFPRPSELFLPITSCCCVQKPRSVTA